VATACAKPSSVVMGPALRRDDSEFADSVFKQPAAFSRHDLPEFCNLVALSLTEGAGKAGRRLRPQHRVRW
jgi:hypothetical protein